MVVPTSFLATTTGDNFVISMANGSGATWNNVANATAATFLTNPTLKYE